jgi:hypothetical protein
MGTLVLARGATPHHVAMGTFLIDVFSLGIKDVMFNRSMAKLLRCTWTRWAGDHP